MKRFITVLAFLAIAGMAAFASSTSATMEVLATLLPTVSVSTSNLDFGTWVIGQPTVLANATVSVQATAGTNYAITMDAGQHYANSYRNVVNSGFAVNYYIMDPTSSYEWSDVGYAGSYPFGGVVSNIGTGSLQSFTAHGHLLTSSASPASPVGTYTDFVTVTVNY